MLMHYINFILGINPAGDLPYFEHDQYEDSRITYDEDRCQDIHALLLCSMICCTSCM